MATVIVAIPKKPTPAKPMETPTKPRRLSVGEQEALDNARDARTRKLEDSAIGNETTKARMGEPFKAGGSVRSKAKGGKVEKVMKEFKTRSLKSSSGRKVTNPKQAIAIAMSEARRAKKR